MAEAADLETAAWTSLDDVDDDATVSSPSQANVSDGPHDGYYIVPPDSRHPPGPFSLDGYSMYDNAEGPRPEAGPHKLLTPTTMIVKAIKSSAEEHKGISRAVEALKHVPAIPGLSLDNLSMTPEELIPRGLQIPAICTYKLLRGFRYPEELDQCGISRADWKLFIGNITIPLLNYAGVAYVLEYILDRVAKWDAQYFRPRGFLMRIDMPGEEKYGLEFMDIHHHYSARKHVDSLHPDPPVVGRGSGAMRPNQKPKVKHHNRVRKKMRCTTRLMFDPISVLKDPEVAEQRGWTNWQKACDYAAKEKVGEKLVINNKPWDWNSVPKRKDRWPPGKHLFYDRFRGRTTVHRQYNGNGGQSVYTVFHPAPDSMDQRAYGMQSVLPADNIPFRIIPSGAPGRIPPLHTRYCQHV
ncbi:uncharacterized protein PAC_13573 [Phialocephala subalpina]|uniref:Uncharacterized protein n=1 Tax=Phialocephala subalpina TaxID=576137 RepID=A0A1L7XFD1_9HELO|nr:uncharacterized protein PAC_13573 [Phialocephala subalpina]